MLKVRLCVCALRRGVENCSRVSSPTQNSPPEKGRSSICDMRGERGLTLIELATTIALMSILFAMTAGALTYYFSNRALDTASRELTSQIREAQTLAVSTGNTYRIDFSDPSRKTYQVQFKQGSNWVNVRVAQQLPGDVEFSSSSPPAFGGDAYMDFYPRGITENGSITIRNRFGSSKSLTVNGETANVGVN